MVYNEHTVSLESLRQQHPRLRYESFSMTQDGNWLDVTYRFHLEPDLVFTPRLRVPLPEDRAFSLEQLNSFAFHVGLVELLSYWKTACAPIIEVAAGYLDDEQLAWWHDLTLHGMGEFFYVNDIPFHQPHFVTWTSTENAPRFAPVHADHEHRGNLILVGGGKDSVVSMSLLENWPHRQQVLMVQPTQAATATAHVAGYTQPLIVQRMLDPQLKELNQHGYLNGHTPFSALLAFISVWVGWMHGLEYVIASNESSANEANLVFHGQPINHQYSKSERFEAAFRAYAQRHLTSQTEYFSLLRPLTELQIAALFAQSEHADTVFSSCNVTRNQGWCGDCPKCTFVYSMLFPFLTPERVKRIFQDDFWQHRQLYPFYRALLGIESHKPLECVGTEQESLHALALTKEKFDSLQQTPPAELAQLFTVMNVAALDPTAIRQHLISDWENDHYVPSEFVALLQNALKDL